MDVIDLHCDLLAYLATNPDRTPYDPIALCSIPQLQKGNVAVQTLAISAETNFYSLCFGLKQLEIFLQMSKEGPTFIPAFENASAFCIDTEPLDNVFKRLEHILTQIRPLYIGTTWNGENRFGGGCGSQSGLKSDGEKLLQFLSGRGIAIDFAHATDALARETLNYIDKHSLDIPVMASHSNFRSIVNHIRNLPDDIAKEIINRNGIIGLVPYKKFLNTFDTVYKMIEHGLKLGGEKALAIGADFFCVEDFSLILEGDVSFFDEMNNASKYPFLIEGIKKNMNLSDAQLEAIANGNAKRKIEKYSLLHS